MSNILKMLKPADQGVSPPGQVRFTSGGTWVCPAGVTSVSVVCIGPGGWGTTSTTSGGGGGGGGLCYKNNISVTPGASYDISAGQGLDPGRCIA